MNADFPRILTLLRKEKGISQKHAAGELGISQALLSHYEKGIRECGLDFLVRTADYYHVSCDYLLGRSPDRDGSTLTVDDIPDPDAAGKDNVMKGSVLPVLNKKLIANSLNILFDLLQRAGSRALTQEVSSFLMLAVYRMFRVVYSVNPKNQDSFFTIPRRLSSPYAAAAMEVCGANAEAAASGEALEGQDPVEKTEELAITTESLAEQYPLFSSSLLNLVQNSEHRAAEGARR
jgi:transcriptional regulator with XRE-family HTH domain